MASMTPRILVLGAGFGGLELAASLSDTMGDRLAVTLIDRNEAFVFGFSKLDVMFGRKTLESVQLPYRRLLKPGVTIRREVITAIDPAARRVTTDAGTYEADVLVVALGAECDPAATPGLVEGGNEFYTVAGAVRARETLPNFTRGRAIVGVVSAPFKCPPAPSECALMLHDHLTERGVRGQCEISLILPFPVPVPPSPDTSRALLAEFATRGITFVPGRSIRALVPERRVAVLDDGSEHPYDLFLGVPKHRVPAVVSSSGLAENGWIPVNPQTLATKFPSVYAVGDVTSVGTPKAGVFAEGAARVVAQRILADYGAGDAPKPYGGVGSCYVEFGSRHVGRVDVNFFSGPTPTGAFLSPSAELADEKAQFGATRQARWFHPARA
jgi:sulfide:quinone oxidoreductase